MSNLIRSIRHQRGCGYQRMRSVDRGQFDHKIDWSRDDDGAGKRMASEDAVERARERMRREYGQGFERLWLEDDDE